MKPGRIELSSLKKTTLGRVGLPVKRIGFGRALTGDEEDLAKDVENTALELKRQLSAARAQQKAVEENTDSENWVAFCFQTREQKEAFLSALKLEALGDKYVNGYEAARRLGVTLPAGPALRTLRRFTKFVED